MATRPSFEPKPVSWQDNYLAAVLETDDASLRERITVAIKAIFDRYQERGTPAIMGEERDELETALNALLILEKERLSR